MRIYLDFDGVLHPRPSKAGPFEFIHLFEGILREFPHVEVVISSSWRIDFDFDTLQGFFAEDVCHQIIGVTPDLPGRLRVDEVHAHLKESGYGGPFIVLDDAAGEFPQNYPPLILCETPVGLTSELLDELRSRVAGAQRPTHPNTLV